MTVRFDIRYAFPIAGLAIVLLVIVFVQLCGTEDVPALDESLLVPRATATVAPTFTPGPSPTPGPVTPTPERFVPEGVPATGEERDQVRLQDLEAIQTALAQHLDERGEYPNSLGGVQSLCLFVEADVGCALEEFLAPIPVDPLGEPGTNGYFYTSDGDSYIVYALRESDVPPACVEQPDHLAHFESLICVEGP